MTTLAQVVLTGVLLGGLYGLFSSGLTLVFGITRVVNFAHGDFVTIGMYAAIIFSTTRHLNPLYMLLPVGIALLLIGFGLHRVLLQRTIARAGLSEQDAQAGQMVLTLAISIIIANAVLMAYGPAPRSAESTLTGGIRLGDILLNHGRLTAFGISLVIFSALYVLLHRTRFGKAVRATVDDRDMATMVGIGTGKLYTVTFGIGVLLAGVTGVVLSLFYPATPDTGQNFLIIAFVTVVLGGLGSVPGAYIAGLIVGVIQELTATYLAIDLQNVGIFVLFIAVLLLRPQGLLARKALL